MQEARSSEVAQLLKTKDAFFGHGVVRDPYPEMAAMLAAGPVHPGTMPARFGTVGPETLLYPGVDQVCVLGYEEVEHVFKDTGTFSADWYIPSLRPSFGRTLLEMDPPVHAEYRQLIQGAFTKKEMDRWEREFVRDLVDAELDLIVAKGRADMVSDFAVHYPLKVIVAACDLPPDDVDMFYGWAAQLTNVSNDEERRRAVGERFGRYLIGVIEQRRGGSPSGRPPDLITYLTHARFRHPRGDAAGMSDEEIVSFLRLLLPAAAQTTYRTLCNLLYGLLTHPDQLEALVADRTLVPQAVEEGLRWEPPLISFGRRAKIDTEIAGCPVKAGTPVNLVVAAADRDPSRWEGPEQFDIFRPPQGHLAFGTGNHLCLGIHAARMELRVAMERILDRLPGLRLDPDGAEVYIGGLGARSPGVLPVLFDAS